MKIANINCLSLFLSICFSMAVANSNYVMGQDEAGSSFTVAVLDVKKVFEKDQRFMLGIKKLKAKMIGMDIQPNATTIRIANDVTIETQPAERKPKRKELSEEEAKLYHETYVRMQKIVAKLAAENEIKLVLRMSGVESDSPQSVMQQINQSIIFQRRLDLTNMVVQKMNEGVKRRLGLDGEGKVCEKCGQKLPHEKEVSHE